MDFANRVEAGDQDDALFSLQEAMGHAAALSRLFWPVDKGALAKARGGKLRMAFGLDGESVLKDRSLRNALEHFDENLDAYLLGNVVGQFVPSFIGLASEIPEHFKVLRLLDPTTEDFYLLGEKFPYGTMRVAIGELYERVCYLDDNGARLRPPSADDHAQSTDAPNGV
jgi:hypothetical protein